MTENDATTQDTEPVDLSTPGDAAFTDVSAPDVLPDFITELDAYKGPLDLLLYLIKENEIDLYDIPIATILDQYMMHLQVIQSLDLNRCGEFLLLASKLLEIKSRIVLPVQRDEAVDLEDIDDPRDELVLQLLEYQRMKRAAHVLKIRGGEWDRRYARDPKVYPKAPDDDTGEPEIEIDLYRLLQAFEQVVKKTLMNQPASIRYDGATVEEKVEIIRTALETHERLAFVQLFTEATDRWDVVATFIAILELARTGAIMILQSDDFHEIYIEGRRETPSPVASENDGDTKPDANTPDASPETGRQAGSDAKSPAARARKRGPKIERFEGIEMESELAYIDDEERAVDRRIKDILARAEQIDDILEKTKGGQIIDADFLSGEEIRSITPDDAGVASDAPPDTESDVAPSAGPAGVMPDDAAVVEPDTATPKNDAPSAGEDDAVTTGEDETGDASSVESSQNG